MWRIIELDASKIGEKCVNVSSVDPEIKIIQLPDGTGKMTLIVESKLPEALVYQKINKFMILNCTNYEPLILELVPEKKK